MQITSVCIWKTLNAFGYAMSLNDVCCYVPVWFGVCSTLTLGLLAYESSRSMNAAVAASLVMAVIPAHLMRSVGGGYDNESVAVTAMCLVFWLWCRSLRNDASWPIGALAGLAYINMVAAWGGFVFVVNLRAVTKLHGVLKVHLCAAWGGRVPEHAVEVLAKFGDIPTPVLGYRTGEPRRAPRVRARGARTLRAQVTSIVRSPCGYVF